MSGFTPRAISSPAELQQVMGASYAVSDEQWQAIRAPLQPAVVIAGAGSGKTTLMAARVVYLVATGQVQPDQILGLTFTTKAAGELAQRVRAALRDSGIVPGPEAVRERGEGVEVLEPTVATYNAYAANLLTEHGLRIGHEPDTRVLADASRYQLAARAVARYTGRVDQLSDHPATVVANLLQMDSQLSEHLVGIDAVREFDRRARDGFAADLAAGAAKTELTKAISAIDRRSELLGLVASYRALKAQLGLMDFSDQIELAARLADLRPEVGAAEREKFRVVLLDEYQDTSVAQALMLSRLFGGGHAVMAVGDPNQAIYGWRGASVSNILDFGKDFPRADGAAVERFDLSTNRRSDVRILEVANRIAAPLYAGLRARSQGEVKELVAKDDVPGSVRVAVHETYDDELAALADAVKQAHAGVAGGSWAGIGVLTRDNAHAGDVFHALSAAEIPVEIVGLKGLLGLPEVAEVVAVLDLLHDLTANDSLLTLLTGPRWAIGPRDLALLGARGRELAASRGRVEGRPLAEELAAAVAGVDQVDIPALSDALEDPGPAAFSEEARERFALLAAELRDLRRHAGEPLLDLVRRIIDTTGIDIELASSVSPAAAARRDNLDLFVKAVADFQAVDGEVTLPALLAYLGAEDEYGNGLDVATPTEADSVKLLTVHRAKGLEWAAVFVVGACEERFPNKRGRSRWVTSPAVMPSPLRGDAHDLPQLGAYTHAGLKAYAAEAKAHDADEELRLAYVAFTRAEHEMTVSSYLWARGRKTPLGPSPYQQVIREVIESWGEPVPAWLDKPEKGATNPLAGSPDTAPWPASEPTAEMLRRHAAADLVRAALADGGADDRLAGAEADLVATWDAEIERLLAEAATSRAEEVVVPLPSSLSATTLSVLRDDPDTLAEGLARPMPRKPSRAARFGTRFHAWVEQHLASSPDSRQEVLVDPEDLPGRGDDGIVDDSELAALVEAFKAGPFADRGNVTVEPPFALVLAGQVVRGRIDAVFAETLPDGSEGALLVDWKTNRAQTADPLQLATYRVAWSELTGIPLERIRAAFYYVRDKELVEPADLPDREALEKILRGD